MECGCTDKSGKLKRLYLSEVEANLQKQYLKKTQNIVNLEVYKCHIVRHGWHLTSSINSAFSSENNPMLLKRKNNTIGQMLGIEILSQLKKHK